MSLNPNHTANDRRQSQRRAKTYFIQYSNKIDILANEDQPFARLNLPASSTRIPFRIADNCASKLRRAVGCLGDSSWPLQSTELAGDLRRRILLLNRILQADDTAVETYWLAQLNTKLHRRLTNGSEIVYLVGFYGEVCDVLAEDIQQGKVNNHNDLVSYAMTLVPFEQFIALVINRQPGPSDFDELVEVLALIINSGDKFLGL